MKRTIIMVFAITLLSAVMSTAQPMDFGKAGDKLGLTDQQIEQMRSLRVKHQSDMIMRRAELKVAQLELREMMMSSKLNESAALSKQEQISKMKSDIAKLKLQNRIAMRKILTDEQLKKWQDMRKDMRPGPGHRPGRGAHGFRGFRGDGPMGPCDRSPMMGPGFFNGPDGKDNDGGEKGE